MNKKGQALVEFILILPVFIMILFLIVDFGTIYSKKANLENITASIVDAYKSGKDYNEIKEIYNKYMINISSEDEYKKIEVADYVDLITPGIGRIMGDPYEIVTERYIYETE